MWLKTGCTAARTQTGIDGAANSASLMTATAANATCLQTVTLASSQREFSVFVRRISGTGAVQLTTDGGTTWITISPTSAWARYDIPAQTVTNPVFGLRLATSGDAVAVDYVQNENGAFASSPILTTAAAATRAAEVCQLNNLSLLGFNFTEGTLLAEFEFMASAVGQAIVNIDNGGSTEIQLRRGGTLANQFVAVYAASGVNQTGDFTGPSINEGAINKGAIAYQTNNFANALNGAVSTDSVGATTTTHTTLRLGNRVSDNPMFGWLRRVQYVPTRLPNGQLQALTA
jgi:hypothetical protein